MFLLTDQVYRGSLLDPTWFTLDTSRGIETEESKVFMRYTVLATDLAIYIPALIYFVRSWHGNRSKRTQSLALLCLLLQPSLILIDNGHFQFNSAMLGELFFAPSEDNVLLYNLGFRIYRSGFKLLLAWLRVFGCRFLRG